MDDVKKLSDELARLRRQIESIKQELEDVDPSEAFKAQLARQHAELMTAILSIKRDQ